MPAKIMIFNQEVSASKQPGNNHAAASAKRIAKDSHWRRKIADESDGFRWIYEYLMIRLEFPLAIMYTL